MKAVLLILTLMILTACGGSSDGSSQSGGGSGASSTNPNPPVIAGCQLFPTDSFWNTPIDGLPVHSLSTTYLDNIASIEKNIKADFGTTYLGDDLGIPFDIVPANQPNVAILFDNSGNGAADESDLGDTSSCAGGGFPTGCYPIPDNVKIEGGSIGSTFGSDDHIIMLQQDTCMLYEVFQTTGGPGTWGGFSGAIWDLSLNQVRPVGVTSADAAGFPILPGLIRYDEIYTDKVINHVIRVTLQQIQSAYLRPPASHSDGQNGQDRSMPPMGLQLRLKANYDISSFDPNIQVILVALKKYGLIVADTGGQMFISGDHDDRWDDDLLSALTQVKVSDFEAVETGATLVDYP